MAVGNGGPAWFKRRDLLVGVGARDALEAKLVERAGFDFIWSSSLGISASHAVPDASLLSMFHYLEAARFMREAVKIPILADGDTGYGDERNVAYAVRRYEEAGIAGICFEDKKFPKENSLLPDGRQELALMEEFAAKIEAACDARKSRDFAVVARVEALIAGQGQEEALRRARAYEHAGADFILIHSRQKEPDEVVEFIRRWDGAAPLVLVPTIYPDLTEKRIRALGKVRMVIYANQPMRAAVKAVEDLLAEVRRAGGIHTIDGRMAALTHIFELQDIPGPGARACPPPA